MTDPTPDLSGHMVGDFLLKRKIGAGTYGDVYLAYQEDLKREVAVKVLHKQYLTEKALERFKCEAQVVSLLNHPCVAQVYACGITDDDGQPWIAMELLRGVTLQEWFKTRGPMTLGQLVPFLGPIAKVIDTGYQHGIIHRDLKPANIMVIENGEDRSPKVLDYGIAKVNDEVAFAEEHARNAADRVVTTPIPATRRHVQRTRDALAPPDEREPTQDGVVFGTAPYMSPEQTINSAAVGRATDIYALGVIGYEALTGRPPFSAKTLADYYQLHRHAAVPPLGEHFSPALDRIFQRALAKAPEDRYGTAQELVSDLRAVLRASPPELLQSSAQRWDDQGRAPSLLLGGNVLAGVEHWMCGVSSDALSDLERAFIVASQRNARRVKRIRGAFVAFVALAVVSVPSVLLYLAAQETRMANQLITEAEVEQGRQALLRGDFSEAVRHLELAYQRGDHSLGVVFMLARALQPRMSELARFTSSSGRMWSARFAPDNKRVLTTDDKSARMWDAKSGQLLFTMSHGDTVYGAVFSPEGSRIITAGGDGTVRIWNAATGAPIRELRYQGSAAKNWRYSEVAMSSHFVAALDMTGRVAHVWDAETGAPIAELINEAPERNLLAFSADGHWLAISGRDEVGLFATSTWRCAITIPEPRVRSLSFDPRGLRLVVGTYDGMASIWEIPTGVRVRSLREAGASVDAVAFSRDGVLVATASRDGTEQVWDAASGGLRTQFNSHHDKIYAVEFSVSGDLLLSAGTDGAAVVSNVATGMLVARLEGPKGPVIAAHFDSESRRVVGASFDGTARVWDAASPYRRWDSPEIGPECDTTASLVPDQRFIALSCRNHGTHVWDTARGELIAELPGVTPVEGGYSSALPALTATGDRAAIARGNTVEEYALPSLQLLRTIVHPAAVNAVAFGPTGHELVSGAVDGSLLITRDGSDPVALPTSAAGIDAAALLADGRVVVADAGGRLRVIGPDRNALLMDLAASSRIRLLRPSPDGRRLVTLPTTSEESPPVLWDLDQYRLIARLEGHVGRVFTARFVDVGGGHEILTAGGDGTARLWNAATGRPRQSFRGDSHFLVDAALAPGGSVIVAGGSDGVLRFWDTSNGRLLWTLQAHRSYAIGVHYEGDELVTRGFAGDVARWVLPSPDRIIEACHASTCASAAFAEKKPPRVRARYHAAMKKSTLKLVIRRETIRALAQLDLVRVAAGANPDARLMDTVNPETGCPLTQAAAPPAKP